MLRSLLNLFVCSYCAASPSFTEEWEGRRLEAYMDSVGRVTIGVGFNVDMAHSLPHGLREAVLGGKLTNEECDAVFAISYRRAKQDCLSLYPELQTYPEIVQDILIDLSFNLGRSKFSEFRKFQLAIKRREWYDAANELENSRWYSQTGNRAKHHARKLKKIQQ